MFILKIDAPYVQENKWEQANQLTWVGARDTCVSKNTNTQVHKQRGYIKQGECQV